MALFIGLGIARYLTIQLNSDSSGRDSIQFRFDIDPIASISTQYVQMTKIPKYYLE